MAHRFAAQRQREIVAIVDRERSVRVVNLARFFQVAEETIRRDLEKLEIDGKLVRSHGGALSILPGLEVPQSERESSFIAEKVAIAHEAVKLIRPDDTILIDASTTALYLARLVPDVPLTVLTNSIQACVELSARPKIRVMCTGGNLSTPSLSFVGPRAEQTLRDYRVNRLFFSCTAIDVDHGLSDTNEMQATLRRVMMTAADENYLLVDRSKFGLKALKRFASTREVTGIITDEGLDDGFRRQFADAGIDLTLSRLQFPGTPLSAGKEI